ncbi:Cro/CI family transcriptional regulator [Testudinibacter sp. P80/BLE/0925]
MSEAIEKAIRVLGSQKNLALACDVSQNAVSKWLNGSRVSLENALKIEAATAKKVKAEDINSEFSALLSR